MVGLLSDWSEPGMAMLVARLLNELPPNFLNSSTSKLFRPLQIALNRNIQISKISEISGVFPPNVDDVGSTQDRQRVGVGIDEETSDTSGTSGSNEIKSSGGSHQHRPAVESWYIYIYI